MAYYKAALFALLALCIPPGEAIQCYSCNSLTDDQCMDKPEVRPTIPCTLDAVTVNATWIIQNINMYNVTVEGFVCNKVMRKDSERLVVFRSCGIAPVENHDYCRQIQVESFFGKLKFCGTCNDTDGCNGGRGLAPLAALTPVVAALATGLPQL